MKRAAMLVVTVFILACAVFATRAVCQEKSDPAAAPGGVVPGLKSPEKIQAQVDPAQLERDQLELRALIAEVELLKMQLAQKIARAKELQASIRGSRSE